MIHSGCMHDFTYLLKQHTEGYTGRVLELPAVIASGTSPEDVQNGIKSATLAYLQTFENEHEASLNKKLQPKLITPDSGIVLKTVQYQVKC